ncbi:MerR family transcriptional regulator [Risungbinella massiliensis]|uniref:MerR family transcriptional regulator n=1 Tax=Risungbinella massiliensis TaxID=1329796 RepID=UPI0005CBD6F8|nr:MerR family transcriptional regulator [Risungbinella massiliensis]
MSKEQNYSIGEFSEKTGTSIRTLHYYDEIGILQPEKHPTSGHRIYTDQDALTLQKIVSLKFLGYRLEDISIMTKEASFDMGLNETLQLHQNALEEKKESIETALKAVRRTISLLEEEGEVDSAVLMSLIHSIQTEKEQRQWVEKHTSKEVAELLYNKSEEEMISLEKEYIQFSKEVKRLVGKPVDDLEVQALIDKNMKASLEFIGEDVINSFSQMVETVKVDNLPNFVLSPYTKKEEEWLNQAMEYYMKQNQM